MNTIHDENKIRELFNDDRSWSDNMKEYAEYIREKTIDECIACVPDKKHEAWTDHNDCREKTITNLTQLKNNG